MINKTLILIVSFAMCENLISAQNTIQRADEKFIVDLTNLLNQDIEYDSVINFYNNYDCSEMLISPDNTNYFTNGIVASEMIFRYISDKYAVSYSLKLVAYKKKIIYFYLFDKKNKNILAEKKKSEFDAYISDTIETLLFTDDFYAFGFVCGYGGSRTNSVIEMENLVKKKNYETLSEWLHSPLSNQAIDYLLDKDKIEKEQKERKRIGFIQD
ncbi:hypothetical protein FACS1894180_1580 [Bacteroidia bacterium]|nr:hypothetical protein FACS1894180_1580 [Bacteroidia bacterium]